MDKDATEKENTGICPICKKRKKAVIENWIGIDRILFNGKKASDVITDKNSLKEFRELKSTLLLNLFEVYNNLGHISFASHKDMKSLEDYSKTKAELALEHAKSVLKMNEVKTMIKEEIALKSQESGESVDNVKFQVVRENLLKTALDSFLFDGMENELPSLNETQEGKILIGAHRKLRDSLIEGIGSTLGHAVGAGLRNVRTTGSKKNVIRAAKIGAETTAGVGAIHTGTVAANAIADDWRKYKDGKGGVGPTGTGAVAANAIADDWRKIKDGKGELFPRLKLFGSPANTDSSKLKSPRPSETRIGSGGTKAASK